MGMKLSEILTRLIELDKMDLAAFDEVEKTLNHISDIHADIKFTNNIALDETATAIRLAVKAYKHEVDDLRKKLNDMVYSNVQSYINEGPKIWAEQYAKMTFEEHLEWSKNWPPSNEDFNYFISNISTHINWQQPTVVIGAGQSDILNSLMGSEPLYTVEWHPEYHQMQKDKLSPETQRKLRCYQMNELKLLPKNAAGLIVVYNQFQFMPWDDVMHTLSILHDVLAPGGALYFTYNNCHYPKSFKFFENGSMTYTLPEMYYKACLDVLKKEIDYTSPYEDFSFMKFVKEGSMNLIKRYPSFGIIDQQPTLKTPIAHKNKMEKIKKVFKS